MYKSLILLACLSFSACASMAQKKKAPDWITYSKREIQFPEREYLRGFTSESNIATYSQDVEQRINHSARTKLVESILVSIRSMSNLEIENLTHNSDVTTIQRFKQTSISEADADLVGLAYENYYDRKKKQAFGFVYARKAEVIAYYKQDLQRKENEIRERLSEARQAESAGRYEQAMEAYLACRPLLKQMEKDQTMLLAVGIRDNQVLLLDSGSELELEVKRRTAELLTAPGLTLNALGYFLAYSVSPDPSDTKLSVQLGMVEYRDSGLESDLSDRLREVLRQQILKVGTLRPVNQADAPLLLSVRYVEEGDRLRVNARLEETRGGKSIRGAQGSLGLAYIKGQGIEYLPAALAKLSRMEQLNLKTIGGERAVKSNQELSLPLVVQAVNNQGNNEANLPLTFFFADNEQQLCQVYTDASGRAECFPGVIPVGAATRVVFARLNLAEYLGMEPGSAFLQKVLSDYRVPQARFVLDVLPLTVYIDAREYNLGRPTDVPFVAGGIQEYLTRKGYVLSQTPQEADLSLTVEASSRSGSNLGKIYFSYVDASVNISDIQSGKTLYSQTFSNVKGGGGSYELGGVKAFEAVSDQVVEEVRKVLE